MLGGSVYIALIRFAISLGGVILLFSMISEPRYTKRHMAVSYVCFCGIALLLSCVWYLLDYENCVRIVAFLLYVFFCIFALFTSRDPIYLTLYKLALVFYLLAVFLIAGIEISILFFERNVWADIVARILLIIAIALFIEKRIRREIRGFDEYVEKELDRFIFGLLIISILFGIGFILNPSIREQTPYRLFQILINFFLTGALQLLVFRLYLHIGREKEYAKENQLMKLNQRLLERQIELLEESVQNGRRIRHDVRHHNAVIAEYARRGDNEELLQYLSEYQSDMHWYTDTPICANLVVNHLLTAYTRRARQENIEVELDVSLEAQPSVPNIDLVTILANAYENAIYGCMEVQKASADRRCRIYLMIKRKRNKLVIFCSNDCVLETAMKNGQPKPQFTGGIGVLSIIKTAERYDGEYDFKVENGTFIFRLVMNVTPNPSPEG